jgi:hypothetical protein
MNGAVRQEMPRNTGVAGTERAQKAQKTARDVATGA